jgi:glyoxylase-like metal-dependent hydrolase (beta-lactamase superfamily II)
MLARSAKTCASAITDYCECSICRNSVRNFRIGQHPYHSQRTVQTAFDSTTTTPRALSFQEELFRAVDNWLLDASLFGRLRVTKRPVPSCRRFVAATRTLRSAGAIIGEQQPLLVRLSRNLPATSLDHTMTEEGVFFHRLRTWRHNPCLMRPVAAVVLLTMCLVGGVGILLAFPGVVLGILVAPVAARMVYAVEFLYPTGLGRWAHFFIIRLAQKARSPKTDDKNGGFHSRAMETRVEVVPERVYIHPLPQLLDNLGYLVLCVPPRTVTTSLGRVSVSNEQIVAFVVDCGDAVAVVRQLEIISDIHYNKQPIQVQSIVSTHKHWDHTGGNKDLAQHAVVGEHLNLIIGGAVEGVPGCNFPVADGEFLPLPRHGLNDMQDLVSVEAVATPAHTRGSMTYLLRTREGSNAGVYMFTGDTMFSAGSGVPFEADVDKHQEETATKHGYSAIKASAAGYAVERCFAELLARCGYNGDRSNSLSSDKVMLFSGHEYTAELLIRQLSQSVGDSCNWKLFSPDYFFETVSQLYVAMHRRSLPHSSGKLLCVPSSLQRELYINPQFRSLRKRGEILSGAIRHWNDHFAMVKIAEDYGLFENPHSNGTANARSKDGPPLSSTTRQWNLAAQNINRQVFTTVYADDFNDVIERLESGRISAAQASHVLKRMKTKLGTPSVNRRPIPNTLPSNRSVFKGLVGFVLLGSRPAALTLADARVLKLPPPTRATNNRIRISKIRLITVLTWLGLIEDNQEGRRLHAMIAQIWREALEFQGSVLGDLKLTVEDSSYNTVDVEGTSADDEVELGALKWVVYGLPWYGPKGNWCRPCAQPAIHYDPLHPVGRSNLPQHAGEMIRHDVFSCYLCRNATGCPLTDGSYSNTQTGESMRVHPSMNTINSTTCDEEGEAACIEVEMAASILKEA